MSDLIERLATDPVVAAAYGRDEKEYFGQGYSSYEVMFQAVRDGHRYSLSVFNTPRHRQVNWGVYAEEMPLNGAGYESRWPWRKAWTVFALTPDESLSLAGRLGHDIATWLSAALEACRINTARTGGTRPENVIDAASFHAVRAGDR